MDKRFKAFPVDELRRYYEQRQAAIDELARELLTDLNDEQV